jgi:hypothetical protein
VIVLAASSSSASIFDQPGTLAFLVVFGMGVAVYFLLRSMSKHLRKVNAAARAEAAEAEAAKAGPQSASQTAAGKTAPPA